MKNWRQIGGENQWERLENRTSVDVMRGRKGPGESLTPF